MLSNFGSNNLNSISYSHNDSLVKNYSTRKQKVTKAFIYDYQMNEEAKNLARNLHLLMTHYSDTQTALEKRSGVSQKTISNMLNPGDDKAPNLDNVSKIAAAYKIKTWHLLLPSAPLEILLNHCVEKLIDNYIAIDELSRDTVLRVTENSARYPSIAEPKKSNNKL